PSGHFGETCLEFRLNSRMSHCAMRKCSRIIQQECGKFGGLLPRRFAGILGMTSSTLACAPPPCRRSTRCWRREVLSVSFMGDPSNADARVQSVRLRLFIGWLFSTKDPRNSAHDPSKRQIVLIIGNENLSDAVTTVVPALEQREVLHALQHGGRLFALGLAESTFDSRLHRLRLGVLR